MRRLLLLVLCVMASAHGLHAQSLTGPGRVPFGSYSSSNVDSINLYNGNLTAAIPVFSLPGRELSTSLDLVYNSQGWQSSLGFFGPIGTYTGGFKIPVLGTLSLYTDLVDCYYAGMDDPDPTGEWLITVVWIDVSGAAHSYTGPDNYVNSYTHDGCYSLNEDSWSAIGVLWLYPDTLNDTTLARVENNIASIRTANGSFESYGAIETRNGNFATVYSGSDLLDDTIGRTVGLTTSSGSGLLTSTYTIHSSEGTARDYVLTYETEHSVYNPVELGSDSISVLKSVELPNGRKYEFEYGHVQGFLTKITLPTGGYIAFDYVNGNSEDRLDYNYIVGRREHDGATENPWTYEPSNNGPIRTVTVTDPEDHQIVHVFDGNGRETETKWWEGTAGSSDLKKTVTTTWDGIRPETVETQVGSMKQQKTTSWESVGPFPSEVTQSDWYTGSMVIPLTKTIYTYNSTLSGNAPFDMVPSVVELQQWDGMGYVAQGKTEYLYDQYSVASTSSSVPQHHTPTYARLNVTSINRYWDASNYLAEHFHYDNLGNVVEHIDERGKSTAFDFTDNFDGVANQYAYAYPKQVTVDPSGLGHHVATTVYSFHTGLPVSITDARGKETTFTYDLLNRPLEINGPVTNAKTSFSYDDATPKLTESVLVASGKSRTTEMTMDQLGRSIQTKVSDPDGNVFMDTEYDGNGQVKRVSAPYRSGGSPVWTETTHDVLGRTMTVTNPDTSDATFSYVDNTVTLMDEADNQRRYTSNAIGQLTKVEEPNPDLSTPLVTNYSYYVFGPLYQVTQTGPLTRTFTADWLGRTTSESHPENGTTTYTYDGGLVATRTDSRSTPLTTSYAYDDLGRLDTITYSDSTPDVDYTYDATGYTGLLTSVVVSGVTSSSFTYDDGGQLLSEAVTRSGVTGTFTTSYTWDLAGRLLKATYPSGREVTGAYALSGNVAGDRLERLTNGPTSTELLQSIQTNAAGLLTSRTLGAGITETRTFNSRNQLTHVGTSANSATLLDLGYAYGGSSLNNGKIRARTDAVQSEHSADYTYDDIGRLTAVSGGNSSWGISYTLDAYGNRTAQTPTGLANGPMLSQSIGYTNNKNNGYSYDGAGNVTYDGTYHYYYDAENRIYMVGSSSIQYAYDAAGRRIKRTVPEGISSVTTHYFYGLTGLMSEFSTSSSLSNATEAASGDRIQYRVGEQTGTGVMLMAADGTPRENNRVFPFGEAWNYNSGSDNNEKFTTYQRDSETDLDYAMARYYAARSGRFMTPDPGHVGVSLENPQSWNAYIYAMNDPINIVDNSGTEPSDTGFDPLSSDCLYNIETGQYSYACPGQGNAVAEGFLAGLRHLAKLEIEESALAEMKSRIDPDCVIRAISAHAKLAKLDISGMKLGVQIVGTANAAGTAVYTRTDMTVMGDIAGLERQMCNLNFYSKGQTSCPRRSSLVGPVHTGQDNGIKYTGNFREPVSINSLQVNTAPKLGLGEMDIDQGNPASVPFGAIIHAGQYLGNWLFSTDNSYGCMEQ